MTSKYQGTQNRSEEKREDATQDEKRMNTSGGDQGQGNRQDDMSSDRKRGDTDNS